ncbi:Alpha/Beta hydrolase protein [Mycena metata]|uniref:Alpha/Beta hydrolase protein n=1 Tax=Mycena metata TaxID=1033252 RepID=A0AAD7KFS0_9AGAR|nr:Alpha/Beta hydrolase protein [Mycena metata]
MSCPDCFKGAVLDGEPTGSIVASQDGAYFAPGNGDTKRAIILLTDIFGLPLKNSKILADSFAQHLGCDVWVPDLFAGHPPLRVEQMQGVPERAGLKLGFFGLLKVIWGALPSIPALYRNRAAVADPRLISWVEKLQESKKYEKLGAIGYCYGGGVATRVGATTDLFQSIVLAHPSPPSDAHLRAIKAPTAWSAAEEDMGIKAARMNEIEALYAGRKGKADFVEYEIKTYKGTRKMMLMLILASPAHGFAARPNFEYPEVKEGFEQAFKQAVEWFNKTLPV